MITQLVGWATDKHPNSFWYKWLEVCDNCGDVVRGLEWKSSNRPDVVKAHFCLKCLRYMLDCTAGRNPVKARYLKKRDLIDIEVLSLDDTLDFNMLVATIKHKYPDFTMGQIQFIVSLVVNVCSGCYENDSRCQCWNDE